MSRVSPDRHPDATAPLAAPAGPACESRRRVWGCAVLYLVGLFLLLAPRAHLPAWHASPLANSPNVNTALAEALRWREGRLDLAQRFYESAQGDDDRPYNVVGLAFTLLAVAGSALTQWFGGPPDSLSTFWYVALVALPLPLAAFAAFRQVLNDSAWAGVLAAGLLAGTSLAPVLCTCRTGSVYYINHVLAATGLLLMTGDLLGPRRIWPAAIGLALAAWSRQLTVFYAVPLLLIALRHHDTNGRKSVAEPADSPAAASRVSQAGTAIHGSESAATRPARIIAAVAAILIVVAVPLTLNWLKFGHPLDTGYGRMFTGRTDRIGAQAQQALFSPRYLPMHLRAALFDFPAPDIRQGQLYLDRAGLAGGSIFLTTPLLAGVLLTLPWWWRDAARRWLMLATLPVLLGVMCYVTTGSDDSGYYRYALDVIPVWLVVIAPRLTTPRARPWTLGCIAWSALYFYMVG